MPASQKNNRPEPGFGLYFHWPFCRKKCPYCDFNSHVRDQVDQKTWTDALLRELDWFAKDLPSKPLTSIFFGGGTPSLMAPETVASLIDGAEKHFGFSDTIEISLEANPTSAEAKSFAGYRTAGVNRLSMGVQSLRDEALQFLGREHSAKEALQTIELARRIFPNISFDMIYALPDQTLKNWCEDLTTALALAGDHISLYQLTIEPNTGFAGALKRREFEMPQDELAEDMFGLTQDLCEDAGLPAYEISNHARPGFECRHNLTYWRYGHYLGIGPGAHGRIEKNGVRRASKQIKRPERWLESVLVKGHGTAEAHSVEAASDLAEELLLMGLRLNEGVWFDNFRKATGQSFFDSVSDDKIQKLTTAGFLDCNQNRIKATEHGRFVLNSLLAEMLS